MGFTWKVPPEKAFPELATAYTRAIDAAVLQLANSYAPEIAAWMKQNAPWTDRTGNARQTLDSEVIELAHSIVIAFGHGVDYGKYLENSNAGKYAIIGPALDYFAPRIWADVRGLFS